MTFPTAHDLELASQPAHSFVNGFLHSPLHTQPTLSVPSVVFWDCPY